MGVQYGVGGERRAGDVGRSAKWRPVERRLRIKCSHWLSAQGSQDLLRCLWTLCVFVVYVSFHFWNTWMWWSGDPSPNNRQCWSRDRLGSDRLTVEDAPEREGCAGRRSVSIDKPITSANVMFTCCDRTSHPMTMIMSLTNDEIWVEWD